MKPQELRIGNWVWIRGFFNYEKKPFRIFMIDGINDCTTFNPIPLTPEILKAAGFEIKIHKQGVRYIEINPLLWLLLVGEDRVHLCLASAEWMHDLQARVVYLHQLQNLVYSLTGEELNIDIKPDTI